MRNEKVRDMAYYAVFVAIITIMTFVPSLGYITLGGISITILHVIVLLAAFTMGKKGGLVAGLAMGILCMLKAWIAPGSIYDYPFRNPLCAVLPRALFGFVAGYVADLIYNKSKKEEASPIYLILIFIISIACTAPVSILLSLVTVVVLMVSLLYSKSNNTIQQVPIIKIIVATVLLTAFHSVVTVPLLYLCATWVPELKEWCASNELLIFFGATFVGNSIFEIIVAGVATAPIIMVSRPTYLRGRKKK